MLLIGKNRLDLKGLEINKVINVPCRGDTAAQINFAFN